MTSQWGLLIKALGVGPFGADGLVVIQTVIPQEPPPVSCSVRCLTSQHLQQSMYPLTHQAKLRHFGCGFAALCSPRPPVDFSDFFGLRPSDFGSFSILRL